VAGACRAAAQARPERIPVLRAAQHRSQEHDGDRRLQLGSRLRPAESEQRLRGDHAGEPQLRRRLATAWSVIAFESLFPLAILAGPKGALVFLGIGVMFHLANAAVMGLNNFVWAFTATYPAVHYCAERIQTLLRG
jgi:hypothetical protein